MKTYYDILNIPPTASQNEIRNAYLKLAKILHPDRGGSTEQMQTINEAYSILSNEESRREYDSFLNHTSYYSSQNSNKNEDEYIQIIEYDYNKGFDSYKLSKKQIRPEVYKHIVNNTLYCSYIYDKPFRKTVFMSMQLFEKLKTILNSEYFQIKYRAKNNEVTKEIHRSKFKNNYKAFIHPDEPVIYTRHSIFGYYAISPLEYINSEHDSWFTKIKKYLLDYISTSQIISFIKTIFERLLEFALYLAIRFSPFLIILIIGLFANCCDSDTPSSSGENSYESSTTLSSTENTTIDPDINLTPVQRPSNNEIWNISNKEQIAPFSVSVPNDGNDYYIKLKDTYTKETVVETYAHSGSTISLNVPLGNYDVVYACGETWYGKTHCFGSKTVYYKCDTTFNFYIDGNTVQGWTVELTKQYNGNMETESISADEF